MSHVLRLSSWRAPFPPGVQCEDDDHELDPDLTLCVNMHGAGHGGGPGLFSADRRKCWWARVEVSSRTGRHSG